MAAAEPQLVFAPGKTMGINPPPAELNVWPSALPSDSNRVSS